MDFHVALELVVVVVEVVVAGVLEHVVVAVPDARLHVVIGLGHAVVVVVVVVVVGVVVVALPLARRHYHQGARQDCH